MVMRPAVARHATATLLYCDLAAGSAECLHLERQVAVQSMAQQSLADAAPPEAPRESLELQRKAETTALMQSMEVRGHTNRAKGALP